MKRSFEEENDAEMDATHMALYGVPRESRSVRPAEVAMSEKLTEVSLSDEKKESNWDHKFRYETPIEILRNIETRNIDIVSYKDLLTHFNDEIVSDELREIVRLAVASKEHLDATEQWSLKALFSIMDYTEFYEMLLVESAYPHVDFEIFSYLVTKARPYDGFERIMCICLANHQYGKAILITQQKSYNNSWTRFSGRQRYSDKAEQLLAGKLFKSKDEPMEQ